MKPSTTPDQVRNAWKYIARYSVPHPVLPAIDIEREIWAPTLATATAEAIKYGDARGLQFVSVEPDEHGAPNYPSSPLHEHDQNSEE